MLPTVRSVCDRFDSVLCRVRKSLPRAKPKEARVWDLESRRLTYELTWSGAWGNLSKSIGYLPGSKIKRTLRTRRGARTRCLNTRHRIASLVRRVVGYIKLFCSLFNTCACR